MKLSAVLSDLGQTLLDYGPAARWPEFRLQRMEALYPLARELWGEIGLPAAEFGRAIGGGIQTDELRAREHRGLSRPFSERLCEALAAIGVTADEPSLARFGDAFSEPVRSWPRPYPETRLALERLRALGLRMAIITNAPWDTPGSLLHQDLVRWDLDGFFDAFVGSGEVPWRKPHPEFMWAAARALGVSPSECLVIGDNLMADVGGARAAGMRSVWMNRDGGVAPTDAPQPDWVARSLRDAVGVVEAGWHAPGAHAGR